MTNDKIKFKPFVTEIQSRLKIIHEIEGFNIGKNKINFTANNYPILVLKDCEDDVSKVIISCNDMFPFVINTEIENKEIYLKEKDIVDAVTALDSYFMENIGYNNCYGVCSIYNAAKFLLLPFFIYDYRKKKSIVKVQDDILSYLMYKLTQKEANKKCGYVFVFKGKNKKNQKEDKIFLLSFQQNDLILYDFDYNGCNLDIDSGDNYIELPYDKYSNTTGISVIRNRLKNYTSFKMLNADIYCIEDEEEATK